MKLSDILVRCAVVLIASASGSTGIGGDTSRAAVGRASGHEGDPSFKQPVGGPAQGRSRRGGTSKFPGQVLALSSSRAHSIR
jgi:hypothetical protein